MIVECLYNGMILHIRDQFMNNVATFSAVGIVAGSKNARVIEVTIDANNSVAYKTSTLTGA